MSMDKVYIDKQTKTVGVELPKYGEIILIVKDGQVGRQYKRQSIVTRRIKGNNRFNTECKRRNRSFENC
ncbi:hypothetical protein [Enterococcus casseliflavus]|uniref:hypothetical protein n=1 Tax=Enterococcus casseliflavus TaxID=37734 RepID=UPI0022E9007F|nr:hypothetical protein [Enterococcus casseliflavus]